MKDATVIFRPFAVTKNGEKLWGPEKTIDKISSLKQELLQRFNEPAIQMALNETFKSHITTGDEELEEDLIDLLIERLNAQDRTTEQAIIDEARRIIPKLSHATIALLAVIVFSKIVFPYNKGKLETLIKKLSPTICKIKNIAIIDTEYLKQAGCGSGNQMMIVNSPLEQTLRGAYELIFREPMLLNNLNEILQKYSSGDLNRAKVILSLFVLSEDNKFLATIPRQQSINEQVYSIINQDDISSIIGDYKSYTRAFTEDEIKNYFINIDNNWQYVFQLFNQNHIQSLRLTPVGVFIGIRQLSKICGEPIPMELFFQS